MKDSSKVFNEIGQAVFEEFTYKKKEIEIQEDDIVLAEFINYMQKALYHIRLNYFRDCKRRKDYEIKLEKNECTSSKDIMNEDLFDIEILNNEEIKLLTLLYTQGLSYKEISEITNEKICTIKQRRNRAVAKLRKYRRD